MTHILDYTFKTFKQRIILCLFRTQSFHYCSYFLCPSSQVFSVNQPKEKNTFRGSESKRDLETSNRSTSLELNLRYADDITLMAESEEELTSLLKRVKEESEKAGFKFNIIKIQIIASSPIISWQIEGKSGSSDRLYFLGLQNHGRR